jgi:conjugal transfer/entry exclusion protein
MGLAAQQLADLTGVIAAMARAQSLDNAGRLESEAQGRQQMQNFLNYGAGYQPGNAQMFH